MKNNRQRPLWTAIVAIMLAFLLITSTLAGPQVVNTTLAKYSTTLSVGSVSINVTAAHSILTAGTKLSELLTERNAATAIKNITFGKTSILPSGATYLADVSVNNDDSIKLYAKGNDVYIVSDRTIATGSDFSNVFRALRSLETVKFSDDFDTSRATTMAYLFYGVGPTLKSITNLNKFDTRNVLTMQSMFYLSQGSSVNNALTSIDVSSFKTDNVVDMGSMFRGCGGLTSLDLSNFRTEKVFDMGGMFESCDSLVTLNLKNFSSQNVVVSQVMFSACSSLTTIYANYEFNLTGLTKDASKNVTYYDYDTNKLTTGAKTVNCDNMFAGCTKLVGGYGTSYATNANSTDADIKASAANNTYAIIDLKLAVEQDVLKSSQGYFTHSSLSTSNDASMLVTGTSFNSTFKSVAGTTTITKIVFDKASNYPSITGGTAVDTGGKGEIRMVKSGSTMYVLSDNTICFNPASDYMFQNLATVKTIEFNNADTGAVRTMQRFFEGCTVLTGLDLSGFDTSNVLDFGGFMRYCKAITNADAEHAAQYIDTSRARDLGGFFCDCDSLTGELDLSAFTCPKVETLASFISECDNITKVWLTGLTKPSSLYNISDMFSKCPKLTTIYTRSDLILTNMPTISPETGKGINSAIFTGCTSLVGGDGAGTKFNASNVGMALARPYASGTAGYFTAYTMPATLSMFALSPLMLARPAVSDSDAAAVVSGSDVTAAPIISGVGVTIAPIVSASDVVSETDVTTTTETTTTTTAVTTTTTTTTTTKASVTTSAATTTASDPTPTSTKSTAGESTTAVSEPTASQSVEEGEVTTTAADSQTADDTTTSVTTSTAATTATAAATTAEATTTAATAATTTAATTTTTAPTTTTAAPVTTTATTAAPTTTTAAPTTTTTVGGEQ